MVKSLSDIKPNKGNPRTISADRVAKLREYLAEYGDLSGLVYNSNPEAEAIVSGHQRTNEFKKQKGKLIILERYDPPQEDGTVARGFIELANGQRYIYREVNWAKEKADAATIVANGQFGEWDSDKLANEWSFEIDELLEMGVPDFVFGDTEEGAIQTNALNSEALDDDFQVPEIEEVKTDIIAGDLFEIGPHRLLCGDSTKVEDVARLMGGRNADIVLTDPPYGVSYVGKTKDAMTIENDSMTDIQTFELWGGALSALWPSLKDGGAIYATVPAGRLQLGFMRVMEELGALRQVMVWNKSSMVMGHSDYHYKHEPILYGWKPGAAHYFTSDRTKTTVLDFDKPQRNGEHPTMKPIALWSEMMGNSSKLKDVVVDPFSGSGTTMVTANQIGRVARCMEIDPKYCQVIINRMIALDPDLEIKKNGEPYRQRN